MLKRVDYAAIMTVESKKTHEADLLIVCEYFADNNVALLFSNRYCWLSEDLFDAGPWLNVPTLNMRGDELG